MQSRRTQRDKSLDRVGSNYESGDCPQQYTDSNRLPGGRENRVYIWGWKFGDRSVRVVVTRGMTGVNYRRRNDGTTCLVLAIPVNNRNRDEDVSIFAARYIDSSVGLAAASSPEIHDQIVPSNINCKVTARLY